MPIIPDLKSTTDELAKEFRALAKAGKMVVVGDDAAGLAAYPASWNKRVMLCTHADRIPCAPGYDDRAGVAVMFDLMKEERNRFAYSLFMDEETGAQGSRNIALTHIPHIFVGLDRRGIDQVAFYDDESREDWGPWVRRNNGDVVRGTFSDCTHLSRRYDRYCLNLSVGFASEHTTYETFDPRGADFAREMALKV
jgi:putative aminopeptidase FrvX